MEIAAEADPLTIAARPELTGGRRIGVLLSHGFTGSPASVRPWGEHLGSLGYGVEVPRLPGHGTSWRDLNTHSWPDWVAELEAALDRLAGSHDVVVMGGLSMGGSLTLRLAADHPDRIAGLMLVNPAIATRRLDVKALPVLKHVVPAFPGVASNIKKPGVLEGGYDKTPLKAIHSLIGAWRPLRDDLTKIHQPLIYFRSTEDAVVDDSSQPIIIGGVSSRDITEVSLPDSYHVATLDNDAPFIFERSAQFIARITAARRPTSDVG